MDKIKPLKPDEFRKAIEKLGFKQIRSKGSHVVYRHEDGRWITIPYHQGRELTKGFIHKILKDAKLTWNDIEEFL